MGKSLLSIRTKKTKKKIVPKGFELKHIGEEPTLKGDEPDIVFARAYNWFNYFDELKERREYINDYLEKFGTKSQLKSLKNISDNKLPVVLSSLCRMITNGLNLDLNQQRKKWFNTELDKLLKTEFQPIVSKKTTEVSIQDRVKEAGSNIIADIEEIIDTFIESKYTMPFDAYGWFQKKEVKPIHCSRISQFYSGWLDELKSLDANSDPQLREGYKHLSKAQRKSFISFLNDIVDGANRHGGNTKKLRSPRQKKPQSVEKQVAKLHFLKEDNQFKTVSIDPTRIINAERLWVWVPKSKELQLYVAEDRGGLKIKGSNILCYDKNKSFRKRLRKPESLIKDIISNRHKTAEKELLALSTKKYEVNGKTNKMSILLGVVKGNG